MRSLTTEVIRHGRITTTLHRAKAIRGEVFLSFPLARVPSTPPPSHPRHLSRGEPRQVQRAKELCELCGRISAVNAQECARKRGFE